MLPNEALPKAADLMNQIRPVGGSSYYLYVSNRQLALCAGRELPRFATVIAHLMSADINKGLTTGMWSQIDSQLRTLISKGEL